MSLASPHTRLSSPAGDQLPHILHIACVSHKDSSSSASWPPAGLMLMDCSLFPLMENRNNFPIFNDTPPPPPPPLALSLSYTLHTVSPRTDGRTDGRVLRSQAPRIHFNYTASPPRPTPSSSTASSSYSPEYRGAAHNGTYVDFRYKNRPNRGSCWCCSVERRTTCRSLGESSNILNQIPTAAPALRPLGHEATRRSHQKHSFT